MIRKRKRLAILLLTLPVFAFAATLLYYNVLVLNIARSALDVGASRQQLTSSTTTTATTASVLRYLSTQPTFVGIHLQDDKRSYFTPVRNKLCLLQGVDINRTLAISGPARCECNDGKNSNPTRYSRTNLIYKIVFKKIKSI
jgi:hypothetical protein